MSIKKNWIIIFVVFLLLGLFSYHQYSAIPTKYVRTGARTVNLYTWNGDLWGEGIVTEDNPLWPKGERVSLPIYPMSISKEAEVGFSFNVSGNRVNLTFSRELRVLYYISYDKKRIVTETYSLSKNVSSGRGFEERLIVNISDISQRIKDLSSYLRLPRQESGIEVVGVVTYSGTVDGKNVAGNQTFKGSIELPFEGFYTILGDSQNRTITTTETHKTEVYTHSRKRVFYLLGLVLSGAVALTALGVGLGFRPDEGTLNRLELEAEASKFSKWISRGKLEDFTPVAKVRMSSLSDLVNAAIDMNARAIHDEEKGVYFVVHEGVFYYFKVGGEDRKKDEPSLQKDSGKP
ncbi:DUF5305 family protein [Thermococcus profundus]|nr:DUF5305 family protein [Thermococcus profundus]